MVLGPSYFSENVVRFCSVLAIFCLFLQYFVVCAKKTDTRERQTSALRLACVALPLGRRNSSNKPMASASVPASELAVQLPAPASSLAVPPQAASTAEAVDLSAKVVILEDSGPAPTYMGADAIMYKVLLLL